MFLTRDERVKILDFGLAKLTEPVPPFMGPATRAATEPGLVLGTVGYMSPEQVRGDPADHRSDVFSFGALIYEMASGRPVFGRATAADTLSAILHEDPPDLTTYSGVSPSLERIVRRCLEKNPEERFQSARDVGFALEALSGVAAPTSGAKTVSVRSGARERLAWVIAVAAVAACGATLLLALKHGPGEPAATSLVRFSVLPMEHTTFASTETAAETPQLAVSPNGRYVVFAAGKRGERPRLWLRALDSLALKELAGTDDASFPFWSPDSRYIGFFTAGRLKKVAATGESSQTICDVPTGRGGTWGADGTILFAANIGDGLYRVAAAGGVPTPVTKLDAARQENSHRWPQFLPDGRHFLFVVRGARAHSGIYVAALDSPERTRLLGSDVSFATVAAGHAFFVKGGSLLAQPFDPTRLQLAGDPLPVAEQVASGSPSGFAAFGVSESGVLAYAAGSTASRQLTWFDRRGRALETVGVAGEYMAPVLSPDGRHIAIGQLDARMRTPDIWLVDLARGNSTRFTYSPAGERLPLWSPDGAYILFSSTMRGPWDFYRKPSSGGGDPELVFESSADKFPTDWSADGRFIVFTVSLPGTRWDIWLLPLFGSRTPVPYLQTEFDEIQGRLSPNGRWMAYTSNTSGTLEVYVQPTSPSGGKWLISTAGGFDPRWRRDGRELFYIAANQMLMAVPVKTEGAFEAGIPKPLFQTRVSPGVVPYPPTYDVTAEGQRFLLNTLIEDAPASPITVVLNGTAGLKK